MATKDQLQDEIQALKKQIDKYKRKFQDEVELKRQCEEELRKMEGGGGSVTTREWRAGSVPSCSSSTSSASSSTSTTPRASSDAVPTRPKKKKEKKDKSGLAKEKKDSGSKEKKKKSKTLQSGPSAAEDAGRGRSENSAASTPSVTAASVAAAAAGSFFTVKAIETYKAASKGELSFAKGTTITVLEENVADGLYKGQIGKKEGWFPSFYAVRV
jgi:hypothetical protein